MNNRIKELLNRSGGEFYEGFLGSPNTIKFTEEELKTFAELIVRECAKVCRDQPNVYALKADRDNCAIAIEEHFGVEE